MIGQILGNRYEILEKIGEGGMSEVYKARCNKLNRFVAVKILKESLANNEEIVEKFKNEATAIAALSDNNIVNVLDVGTQDNINYIVMELVKGKTLKNLIVQSGKMNYELAVKIAIQVAKALECAHKNGIIHRDVKPQNILVTEEGVIKVTDFGIAKSSGSGTLTNTSTVLGSAHYFSPEQAKGTFLDLRTDLYSLGVVLYEMTTGRLPFDAESPVTIALKHIQEEPIPPKQINSKIPESLNNLILKAMSKEPSKRYQSAKEMLVDLQKVKDDPNVIIGEVEDDTEGHTIIMSSVNPDELNKLNKETLETSNKIKNDDDYYEEDGYYDDDDYYDDDYYDDDNHHKKNKMLNKILIAVITILSIAVIGTFGYFMLSGNISDSSSKEEISIPDINGMTLEDATKALEKVGLKIVDGGTEKSDEPEGTVINVHPKVGTKVKKDSEVRVILSAGETKINMPNIIGSNIEDAKTVLSKNGLENYTIEEQYSDSVDYNDVISTDPSANEEVTKDTKITIYVSLGKKISYVTVEDVTGLSENAAKSKLESLGLQVSVQTKEVDDSQVNLVVSQSISGKNVEEGTTVTIYVGIAKQKPTTYSISNYINKTMTGSQAQSALTNSGFTNVSVDGPNDGIVTGWNIEQASKSDSIVIYTKAVEAKDGVSNYIGYNMTGAEAKEALISAGFTNVTISGSESDYVSSWTPDEANKSDYITIVTTPKETE